METSPRPLTGPTKAQSRAAGSAKVVLVAALASAVLAGLAVWAWVGRVDAQKRAYLDEHSDLLASMIGPGRPVKNALGAGYVDADGDLVADAPAAGQLDPPQILFSYVASEQNTADAAAAAFAPMTDALAAATGRPVRYVAMTDADAQVAALRDGALHVCAFNTGAVPLAVDAAGFVPVALLGGEQGGPSTYQLKVIASTRTNVTTVEALRGRELALTEMSSNSGFKAPLVLLRQKFGLRPGFDFGIRYSLGHAESIKGLADGTFDAAAVAGDVLARAEKLGTIRPDQYRVLYTSDPFPTACFGYAHALKPALATQIAGVLAGFTMAGTATADYFAASGQDRLVKVDYKRDFALVREIDDAIGYEHKVRPVAAAPEAEAEVGAATMPAS